MIAQFHLYLSSLTQRTKKDLHTLSYQQSIAFLIYNNTVAVLFSCIINWHQFKSNSIRLRSPLHFSCLGQYSIRVCFTRDSFFLSLRDNSKYRTDHFELEKFSQTVISLNNLGGDYRNILSVKADLISLTWEKNHLNLTLDLCILWDMLLSVPSQYCCQCLWQHWSKIESILSIMYCTVFLCAYFGST